MLTQNQNIVVHECFRIITSAGDRGAELFCERLRELDPSMERLFRDAMFEQAVTLIESLTAAVERFDDLEPLGPVVCDLVRRRMLYEVANRHYDRLGTALLRALEHGLSDGFASETKEAWATIYGLAAETMKQAAREALAAAWIELRAFASREGVSSLPLEATFVGA